MNGYAKNEASRIKTIFVDWTQEQRQTLLQWKAMRGDRQNEWSED